MGWHTHRLTSAPIRLAVVPGDVGAPVGRMDLTGPVAGGQEVTGHTELVCDMYNKSRNGICQYSLL